MKITSIMIVIITLILLLTIYNPSAQTINEKRYLEDKEKIKNWTEPQLVYR